MPNHPYLNTSNPYWAQAIAKAKQVAESFLPDVIFTATIEDHGYGPILEVTAMNLGITQEGLATLDYAISALGWRGWSYDPNGIAFKPTTVELDPPLTKTAALSPLDFRILVEYFDKGGYEDSLRPDSPMTPLDALTYLVGDEDRARKLMAGWKTRTPQEVADMKSAIYSKKATEKWLRKMLK